MAELVHHRCWLRASFLVVLVSASPALAQTRLDPGARPGDELLPPPEFAPPVPELGRPAPPPRPRFEAPRGAGLALRGVRIVGNTTLPQAELDALAAPYIGRNVGIDDLVALRDAVTRAFIDQGYVNSGAVIPDQDVEGGIVTLEIIEGSLGPIEIKGLRNLRTPFVEARLRRGAGPPLNVGPLQERLQLLLLDPNIERLDARLGPGDRSGVGRLEVDVVERPRLTVETRVANDISPSIGGEEVEMVGTFRTVAGFADPLRIVAAGGQGYRKLAAGYSVPLTARDLRLEVEVEVTQADIVEENLQPLGIESRTRRASIGLALPILQRVQDTVTLRAEFERERSQSFLSDEPFAFSPGTDEGQTDLSLLRFDQDWLRRERSFALAARSTFTVGLDVLGATDGSGQPDGQFLAWLGLAEAAARPFGQAGTLVLRGGLQLADDALPTIEQIAIGGSDTVRGFPENQLVTDNGWFASIEYRYPILDLAIPALSRTPEDGRLFIAPFADAGGGWNERAPDPDPRTLASLGAGLLWSPSENLSMGVYWGIALVDTDDQGNDPQDWGIHFQIRTRFP